MTSVQNQINDQYHSSRESEDDKVKRLMQKKKNLQQQNSQKLKSILQKTYQMQETASNTNVQLHSQTQKLEQIKKINDSTGQILKQSEHHSKLMTSWRYYLWQKVKNLAGKKHDKSIEKPDQQKVIQTEANTQYALNSRSQNGPTSGIFENEKYQNDQDAQLDQICNQVKKLKQLSKTTGNELTRHHELLDDIDKKMDKNSDSMAGTTKRLNKKFF